jgi:Peptidase family C54
VVLKRVFSHYQQSLFSKYPEVCAMASLDPSIALGFYCKDQADFDDVVQRLQTYGRDHPRTPELFTVQDRTPDYAVTMQSVLDGDNDDDGNGGDDFAVGDDLESSAGLDNDDDDGCDDFVVL